MTDLWFKPDYQQIELGGECTAYAGVQDAGEASHLPIFKAKDRPVADTEPLAAACRAGSDD